MINKTMNSGSKKFVKLFIPFAVFIVGGSYGLREFTDLRYQYPKVTRVEFHQELKKAGINTKEIKQTTLEEHYEKVKKDLDIDNWENVRIPRPWDEEEEARRTFS